MVGSWGLRAPHQAIQGQLLYRNVQRFRGGLALKAHRLLYHSALGLRVIQKKKYHDEVALGVAEEVLALDPRRVEDVVRLHRNPASSHSIRELQVPVLY